MSRLLERARRLAGMGPHEIYTRARQAAGKRADVLRHRFGADPFHATDSGPDERGPFFLAPEDVPLVIEAMRRRMTGQVDSIVAQAQGILQRRFDLLGYTNLDFGREVDWFLDPVNRKRAPHAPWPAVPFLKFEAVGDHKLVWELNRHQWMVTLAKAYRLTGDEAYAAELQGLWRDWQRANPYPMGINWASTLEVAFRAYAWMWTAFLLERTPADSAEFQKQAARQIERAGWFINRYLSTYFSPNTHLLGEGAVLFLIAIRYPGFRHAPEWRRTGWEIVTRCAARQVRADGFYFEQSTYYHVYALDIFLHARLLAERGGSKIPTDLDAAIHRMASVLAQLSQGGALPRFGDDDGGRLFDPRRNTAGDMTDPLSTAAVLFRDPELKAAAGRLTEETLWLLGPASSQAFDSIVPASMPPRSIALPESGIYAMVSPGPPAAQLFIDAGAQGALSAGHGHADALSIQLASGGRLCLTDPGTCLYAAPGGQRDQFRGTPAHNTVTVDGLSQADPKSPFSWGPLPRVEVTRWISAGDFDLFEGRHSGYTRLPDPVVHRRLVFRFGSASWLVRDCLEGRAAHEIESRWHFPPAQDDCVLSVIPAPDGAWQYVTERYDYSPVYGQCVPAPVLRGFARVTCPAETAVILTFGSAGTFRRDGAVYEYLEDQSRHLFYFGAGKQPWTYGEWGSDAAFFYCRTSFDGKCRVFAADGTYVDCAGQRLAASFPNGTFSY
jgi:hypothetical protein